MNYAAGMLKYIFKGPFTNPVAFYIYGAGFLAILTAFPSFLDGQFVEMAIQYFSTRYLPPTSVTQIIFQTVIGSVAAGVKWFLVTPRIG